METSLSDQRLFHLYVTTGDRAALDGLIRRYLDFVYATARRQLGGDADTAADVTQAVFLVLARKAAAVPSQRLGGWLFRTTCHAAADARKLAGRRERHERFAAQQRPEAMPMPTDSSADPHSLVPMLNDAIAALSAADREAVILRYFRCVELPDVAAALGVNEAAARKRVTRAVDRLRKYFSARGEHAATTPTVLAAVTIAVASKAPAHAASFAAASPAAVRLSNRIIRGMYGTLIKVAAMILIATAATVVIGVKWFGSATSRSASPIAAADQPAVATTQSTPEQEPATRPTAITFAQLLTAVQKNEHQFQNLHIKNFETTVDTRERSQTVWMPTKLHYAGSAWYADDARGPQRVYFSDYVMKWEQGAAPWYEQITDNSWDDKEGRELILAAGPINRMSRMRDARLTAIELDAPGGLGCYTRALTGSDFTIQFAVTQTEGGFPIKPRVPVTASWEQMSRSPENSTELVGQTVNGFNTIRLQFVFRTGRERYWFDPSHDYALIKDEHVLHIPSTQYTRIEGKDIFELKEAAPGIWYPTRGSSVREEGANYSRYTYRADEVTANDPHFDPAIFRATFPTGWTVQDWRTATHREYITMDNGTEQNIRVGQSLPNIKAGIANRPDGEGPAITRSRDAAW